MRCRNGGDGRISHTHHRILEIFDCHVELIIFLLDCQHKNHPNISSSREISSLIPYNQSLKVLFSQVNTFVNSLKNATTDCIHFGVKLHIQHPVSKVDKRALWILPNGFRSSKAVEDYKATLTGNDIHIFVWNVIEVLLAFF